MKISLCAFILFSSISYADTITLHIQNNSGHEMSADLISSGPISNACVFKGETPAYNFNTSQWEKTFDHRKDIVDLPAATTSTVTIDTSCLAGGARLFVAEGSPADNFNSHMSNIPGEPNLATYQNVFDKIEMGWNPQGSAGWNITYVDFFGIPFQLSDGVNITGFNASETRTDIIQKLAAAYHQNPSMYNDRFFYPSPQNVARIFSPQHFYVSIGSQWDAAIDHDLNGLISKNNFPYHYGEFTYTNLKKLSPNSLSATCTNSRGSYTCALTNITTGNAIAGTISYSPSGGAPGTAAAANFAGMIATVINRGVLFDSQSWGENGFPNSGAQYYPLWYKVSPYNVYAQVLTSLAIDHKIYASSYDDFWHMDNSVQVTPTNKNITLIILPFG